MEEGAFERLVGPHRRELHAHCYRVLGSLHDAEDALQEAMLRAWRAIDKLGDDAALRAWLYRIATNASLDLIARRRRRLLPVEYAAAADPDQPPGDPVAEQVWLEPYPDEPLEIEGGYASPDASYEQHEAGNQEESALVGWCLGPGAQAARCRDPGTAAGAGDRIRGDPSSTRQRAAAPAGPRNPRRGKTGGERAGSVDGGLESGYTGRRIWTQGARIIDGIPVTDPVSTLVDLAACVLDGELSAAINEAAELPLPETQASVNGHRVDFRWPQLGLVIETDSLRHHRTPERQSADMRRDHAHVSAG
jgi:RNA polymerase sigma factor (sigma-70 family)